MPRERVRKVTAGRELTLGDQLVGAIERSGLSQAELARAADVDRAVLSRFVSGRNDIRLDTADRLARVLGLDLVERSRSRGRPAKMSKSERAESSRGSIVAEEIDQAEWLLSERSSGVE